MKKNRKTALLELAQRAFEAENAFLLSLAQDEKDRAGSLEKWSAKDTIAHIAAWRQRLANNLQSAEAGSPQGWVEDLDHENARVYAEFADKPWEQVQDFAAGAYRGLVDQVTRIAADRLESLEALPWQQGRPVWRLITIEAYTHPYIHLADYYRNRGEVSRAAELLGEMARSSLDLDDGPAWQGLAHYNLACHHALLGEKRTAIQELEQALRLRPDLTEWSQQDTDLDSLREEPGYQALYTS